MKKSITAVAAMLMTVATFAQANNGRRMTRHHLAQQAAP
jgi:hypothetical protein